jgi:dihydroorotase-like cyclic amidohydrolase
MKKAEGKAVCDYAFHCIITDMPDSRLPEIKPLVEEGVTSFKLFMAYPGVFMLDDATIFKTFQAAAKQGAMVCMHAENGGAIDVIVKQALAEGKTAPKYHALTRPTTAEAEATTRWRRYGRRATGDCRCTRKPARSTCIFRSRTSTCPVSKGRNTYSRRRCGRSGTSRSCGRG